MKVTMIPIVAGVLLTVSKGLESRIEEDQLEYLEESWRLEETFYHPDFCEKSPVKTGVKNLQGVK